MSLAKRPRLSVSYKQQPSLLMHVKKKLPIDLGPPWSVLPLEVLLHIFKYLNQVEKRAASLVCTHWNAASNIPLLWQNRWSFLKPCLNSRPISFWSLLNQRQLNYVIVASPSIQSDLTLLLHHLPRLQGLMVIFQSSCTSAAEMGTSLQLILRFRELVNLHLDFTACFADGTFFRCLALAQLTALQSLTLKGVRGLAGCDLSPLKHPNLHSLMIDTCGSFNAGDTNSIVSHFPSLMSLSVKNCTFYKGAFKNLECRKESNSLMLAAPLHHLCLARTQFKGCKTEFPARLGQVRTLDLVNCRQDDEHLVHLVSQLTCLTEVILRGLTSIYMYM